tara:strand:+ start:150 stop:314 length:165 start_codon:yes stop_codon:yes gene_type:complete
VLNPGALNEKFIWRLFNSRFETGTIFIPQELLLYAPKVEKLQASFEGIYLSQYF